MKTNLTKIINIFLIISISFSFFQCSTTKIPDNFTVRIKKTKWKKYDTYHKVNGESISRNGSALRGKVYKIEEHIQKCPDKKQTKYLGAYVVFKDASEKIPREYIPIEDVDLVGLYPKIKLGINWFEQYNNPLDPLVLTEVPIDTIYSCGDTIPQKPHCPCELFDFGISCKNTDCFPPFKITNNRVITNGTEKYCNFINTSKTNVDNHWYYIEIKGGFATYKDKLPNNTGEITTAALVGEISTGLRLGYRKQYGLGLSYFTGVPLINSLIYYPDLLDENYQTVYRPAIMLEGRYSYDEIFCMYPFVYGQLGMAVDNASLQLLNLSTFCSDCRRKINWNSRFSNIPLSFGLGAGIDIPLSCKIALSFDIGFKSIGFGEIPDYTTFSYYIPVQRRVNMLLIRFGLTM